MEKTKANKREWVKTVLIIFLAIMLVLTFFSNTIMNRSLPEVAAQYVQSGAINAKIRGNGTISANETYDVTLSQTRKVRSVLVRTGDEVQVGDLLLTLEPMESDELKQAQDALDDMELNYQKSLLTLSNGSSTEDREVQKLQKEYNEALAIYNLYSYAHPSQITIELKKAEAELKELQRVAKESQDAYSDSAADSALTEAQAEVSRLEGEVSSLEAEISTYEENYDSTLAESYSSISHSVEQTKQDIARAEREKENVSQEDQSKYDEFLLYTKSEPLAMQVCSNDYTALVPYIINTPNTLDYKKNNEYAEQVVISYNKIVDLENIVSSLNTTLDSLETQLSEAEKQIEIKHKLDDVNAELAGVKYDLRNAQNIVDNWQSGIDALKSDADRAQRAVDDQQAVVDKLQTASTAGEALAAAEQALEDKLFDTNLGSTDSLDLQAAREEIEAQKKLIEELSEEADGQEIQSTVNGVVSTIHVTAGNTAGAETPVVTITVADRGYTLQIPVTMEQARQVTIGDTAEITNFWNGDITATLENIINDPKNPTQGKLLMFRLTGEGVEPGANLTLSIGQRSANYDALIPNSAVRTDANGDFVLVVVAKSSPLGNRYVATRADVKVLAKDDTTSAVSGLVNGDYVITTTTDFIEAGDQVRLVDNG